MLRISSIFKSLWTYRFFIFSSIKNDFKSRFSRSKFGGVWIVLHPLAMVLIYALILSQVMTAKMPGIVSDYAYPIYILSGIVCWNLFSEILGRSLNIFIENSDLIKKISFPKMTLPAIMVGTALVNFIILVVVMYIVFFILGHSPINNIIWLPVLVIITLSLAMGIGLFFGIINIFIRDVGQLINIILQFWFWLTPIVYTINIVPEKYKWIIMLNPLSSLTIGYHDVLVYDKSPDFTTLSYPIILAFVMLALSALIFKKANEEMADVL
ncbi:ABC transporter permease [Vibrio ruber]|uniref:ABC transporter permease n=1 Tax=Vibrio ruber TaxID=184755 RepID=UPI00289341F5|nr:ABC transporter permease [Vibrio ruber]WNJ96500.1 ABC transporter permease [Vibrio ruber]